MKIEIGWVRIDNYSISHSLRITNILRKPWAEILAYLIPYNIIIFGRCLYIFD